MPIYIEKCQVDQDTCKESHEISIGYWLVGEWSKNCDEDICSRETRSVVCSDINSICDTHERPLSEKRCEMPLGEICGTWKIESWSEVIFFVKYFRFF